MTRFSSPYFIVSSLFQLIKLGGKPLTGLANCFVALCVASALVLLPTVVGQAAADAGTVDPTFKSGKGANNVVQTLAVQSDGKIIIGGQFTTYNTTASNRVARLNTDGNVDTTFNVGSGPGGSGIIYSLAVQSDGKILVGGQFTAFNGTSRNYIARLNADGSLDTTFSTSTGANSTVQTIAVQNDGKIIIGGYFSNYEGTTRSRIARLNTDGSLDTSFNVGAGANSTVQSIAVQNDGKIIIGGGFTSYNGAGANRVARLNTDGSLDNTFNTGAGPNSAVYSIAIQSDGKILIGGLFSTYNATASNLIARLNSDGSLDTSFNILTGANTIVYSVTVQNDGKIIIGGYFSISNGASRTSLVRLNAAGTLDTTFNVGSGTNDAVQNIAVQNGKIIIGGFFISYNGAGVNRLARLNTDGSLDTTFNIGSGANDSVDSVALQSDGKIIIGGRLTIYNGTSSNHIARLNADGSLDTTFAIGSGTDGEVRSVVVQSDGKIIIGGSFTSYNGASRNSIARLNTDGSLDTTFAVGTGANSNIFSLALQSDGKVIIGGSFSSYNGTNRNRIARLNTDGSLDTTFNIGTGVNVNVYTVAVQADGKVIIGGIFSMFNGTSRNNIARLNTNGSLDTTFNIGTGVDNSLYSLAVQTDGKILIGGYFTSYNGTSRNNIARLNTDGSLDTSFNVGTGTNNTVESIAVQSNGRILIGGIFTRYNGTNCNYITRLNSDGSLDTRFNAGNGANSSVFSIVVQNDGKILIGGGFTTVDTYTRDRIARLEGVDKPLASVALVSNPNPSQYGQNVTFTATTSFITATGTVTFTFGSGGNATRVSAALASGVATYMTSTLSVGNTPVVASYSGDVTFAASTSSVYTQSVTKAATTASLTSSSNPAVVGTNLSFTATLSPLAASGLVTFTFNGLTTTTVPVVNGLASYMTNTLPIGTYTVTATYGGSINYQGSTSQPYTQVIIACNPQVVSSPTDDGQATTCGTFSYALAQTTSGTISFALNSGNTITFTSSLTPTLKVGVAIDGGVNDVILNGNGVAGDGLRLDGGNRLTNLTIRNFTGHELLATVSSRANQLFRVKVHN